MLLAFPQHHEHTSNHLEFPLLGSLESSLASLLLCYAYSRRERSGSHAQTWLAEGVISVVFLEIEVRRMWHVSAGIHD